MSASTTYWLERAWTGHGPVQDGLVVEIAEGRFRRVEPGPPAGAVRLAGLTIPGLANCHSHAFHRALRGRTQRGRGTFWTWREQMYGVAERLTPDTYLELARATYREMVSVGITSVGEFHYLHHGPGGTPYDDPNEMGNALVQAAQEAGLRIALLDTCYLTAGIGKPPEDVQARFSDGTAEDWAARVSRRPVTSATTRREKGPVSDGSAGWGGGAGLPGAGAGLPGAGAGLGADPAGWADVVWGAAVHSVRAVPADQVHHVVDWADRHGAPLHAHLSEQVAENEASLAAYGRTPTQVLADAGALGQRTTAVHATHLTGGDIDLIGGSGTSVDLCPTTERDLGDGIGPSRALHDAGSPLTLGSDSHAVIDLFEEMRAVELDERLATQQRGHWSATELLCAATTDGHRSLGFPGAGRIEVGAPADLVTIDLTSPRTAGTGGDEATAVFAAGGGDVVQVVRDGVVVATADDRADVGAELDRVLRKIWEG